ncbi:hypothetical protein KTI96_15125 [Acinetobacter bereziniae]|uniref:HNH endonuclease n=1 Tax=Acinetobacter bereziniae TaxID=106648 RepID=UPI0021CD9DD8|nr:HNH endonuclease [Acinetobacter bereziniae]MCU4538484.1 hypothetical protein [Acinetobacter bereziniae]
MSHKLNFRKFTPVRTFTGKFQNYRSYKPHLINDFNGRCGYTDCPDTWFGGSRCFHIDHFKPKSKFKHLENDYNNLVYSCSYVNILKTDDIDHMIDPCSAEFEDAFYRDKHGYICANTLNQNALIMHRKLKLGLERYRIVWTLEMLKETLQKLQLVVIKSSASIPDQELRETMKLLAELGDEFFRYFEYLGHKL